MRGHRPPKSAKKHLNICEKHPRNIQNYLYIYLYFYGFALVTSGRDLDASKRTRDVATPKTRMLGVAPIIFFKVDAPKTPKQVFGDPQDIYVCGRGGRRQK